MAEHQQGLLRRADLAIEDEEEIVGTLVLLAKHNQEEDTERTISSLLRFKV